MTSLSWRIAVKDDKARLQGFTCAVPEEKPHGARRPVHLKPWELDVQKYFRTKALPESNSDTEHGYDGRLLLGYDGETLVACAAHCLLKDPSRESPLRTFLGFEGSVRVLKALAVSLERRRQGGAIADEAMDVAVGDMFERANREPVLILGRIHRRNIPSQRLANRVGFQLVEDLAGQDELQNWYAVYEEDDEDIG